VHADGVRVELNDPRVHEWWGPHNMRQHRIVRREISLECCMPESVNGPYRICAVEIPEGLV
jgi:hypothetical protein